jgi:heterotetrameric sarcosine oxidase alpha subunit
MTRGPYRLPAGGRIDRTQRIAFTLDGKTMSGFAGDTLASALLARGVALIGRSFKYHRPRGFLGAGVEEPNGLFTIGEDGRTDPNVTGTTTELIEGLSARRQNAWPSVRFDLMAINSLAAPLLGAGFYYKTFMGPTRGAWMFYERFIRRAAGLGRAVHRPDPDRYESRHAFADVLVIGAGPSGLAAALSAGRAGARVVLVEQDWLLGGSFLREDGEASTDAWLRELEAQLQSLPNVEVLRRTTALGLYDGNTVSLIERRDHQRPDPAKGEPRQVIITLRARAIVFATGATERPVVFSNNDRPGVMLASAVRCYVNRFAVSPGRRAVVTTNNDSAYATAFDLARRGVSVTIADLRPHVDESLRDTSRKLTIELVAGAHVVKVLGSHSVRGVLLKSAADDDRPRELQCDFVCMSGGWSPAVHLTSHGGIKPKFREDLATFVPGGYAPGHFAAGALIGSMTWEAAVCEGVAAGRSAATYSGYADVAVELIAPVTRGAYSIVGPDYPVAFGPRVKAFVDFQNDVTVQDLVIAHQEGYRSVEHLKRYTTSGMGTDQGKTSNINALAIEASLGGVAIPAVGTTTFRPPFTPVAMGALAGRNVGQHFRPVRRSPLHEWHVAHGGELIEAGLWKRAWWYRWAGSTVQSAYIAEMRQVRTNVGLSDASTLGKIDVQGPDAAEFLNRVYVNGFAKLPVGKVRYGVMLNDDGTVLDDGTTSRFSETRFFMTTTTAQAGEVMSWLEFLLQTAWPDLKVAVASVSDEWAAMTMAGPNARAALQLAFPGQDLSDAALPYMGCLELEVGGIALHLMRLSFSGELAYEVYVPADHGVALWEHILASAQSLDIRPIGLEAVASLRIEKGHVAGPELDHRNTLDDLGLGHLVRTDKVYVGRELRQRTAVQSPERWRLVGIESLEPDKVLRGGAILFALTDKIEGHGRGYVTSVTWSTELNKYIALALYEGGLHHEGEQIVCAYPLKKEQMTVRIVTPNFIDPRGERLRA